MSTERSRRIFRSATSSQHSLRDVLSSFFVSELLAPSSELFLVEPWISNVVLLDNRIGRFDALNPDWGRREIRLVDVLAQSALLGTKLRVVSRPNDYSRRFVYRLRTTLEDAGVADRCTVRELENLHTKGLLSDHALITGSMNLTESGVNLNDEHITVSYESRQIAEARVNFEAFWE
jgi:phosphatidylserine/phosphatidylglycerophosphate/cardiolipin synthase-like enzyme